MILQRLCRGIWNSGASKEASEQAKQFLETYILEAGFVHRMIMLL